MRADPRRLVAAALLAALAVGVPLAAHANEVAPAARVSATALTPTPEATEPPAGSSVVTLTNARLRWSLNELLHQAPHFGKNFLTAGLLGNTGGGELPATQWKQADGAVRIERASGNGYVAAGWDGFGTGTDHQVVIDGGTGTVDPVAGTASLQWRGSFGVAMYSGLTGFSITDPVLTVQNGVGTLKARLSGFGVSRDGNGAGATTGPIATDDVVLADFTGVGLTDLAGLTLTPTFYGVSAGHTDQKPDDKGRLGSFPAGFITFVDKVGQAPFWMTSGTDDALKAGAPVSVSFDATVPVAVTPPKATPKASKPKVTNPTTKAPRTRSTGAPQPLPVNVAAPGPIAPPVNEAPASAAVPGALALASTTTLTAAPPAILIDQQDGSSDLGWWIATILLLMAAAAVAAPSLLARPRSA